MTVSPEIAAAQAAYKARPFAATIVTGSFSSVFRFDTYDQAVEYLRSQVTRHGINSSTRSWTREGVVPSETYVTMPGGERLGLEAIGVAVQPEGPGIPTWIVLDDGEVLVRRLVVESAAHVNIKTGKPFLLNGYPVICSELHANGITTVMVERRGHHDRYVVATWAPMMGNTWSWGHYCRDYIEANEEFAVTAARNAKRGRL